MPNDHEFVNSVIEKKPSILTVRSNEKNKHRRTLSDGRSDKSKVWFSNDARSNRSSQSRKSKISGLTRNPLHYEDNVM